MREPLAVISDVHGNVRALDSVLREIERRGVRRIVNLGDCLYGPFDPRPAADRLMGLGIPTVSGNEDRILLEADPASRTARFTRARLELRHLDWLVSLPLTIVDGDALLCHGTPTDDSLYLLSRVSAGALERRSDCEIDSLLGCIGQPLVFCGHDHTPRLAVRDEKMIVNPGSVGCPAYADDAPENHVVENRTPDARFAIVWPRDGAPPSVEFATVRYDAGEAAAEARGNGFPDWAAWIASGCADGVEKDGGGT